MFAVPQLKLQHGPKKAWSDAQGFLTARIEMTTSAQARENEAFAAKKVLERLQPKNSDAGRGAELSAREVPDHPTAASSSAAGEGSSKAVHRHLEAENVTSTAPENLEAPKVTENYGPPETGVPTSVIELPEETYARISKLEEDPQRPDTGHTASTLAISQGLETLVNNTSRNSDVLVSLGTVLDKIQRIADVTVGAVDTLAKVDSQTIIS